MTAAQHFYKALKVYPNTAELLDIYKKTVTPVSLFGYTDDRVYTIQSLGSKKWMNRKNHRLLIPWIEGACRYNLSSTQIHPSHLFSRESWLS